MNYMQKKKKQTTWKEWTNSQKSTVFPGSSDGKESTCNVGDLGSIPGLGRSPGEGIGNHSLHYSGLENPHGQRNKSIKLEIKKLQLTPQKYQRLQETAMNNCMPIEETTQKKWPYSIKVQFPQTEPGRNRKYEQTNHKH